MSKSGTQLPVQTVTLSAQDLQKEIPGFIKTTGRHETTGQFAKSLASGYLRFTVEGRDLMSADSVQNFIELAALHNDLTEQAQEFLQEEVPFVYEDQQIQPLLLRFAAYRLEQVSRRYYFASLQNQPKAILDDLKSVIRARQDEYDALIQIV